MIHGDFRNDKLGGIATYEQKNLPLYFVMFKNGMMVVLDDGTFNWMFFLYVLFSMVANALIYYAGPFIFFYPDYTFACSEECTSPTHIGWTFFAFYPFYLIFSIFSGHTKYLTNC